MRISKSFGLSHAAGRICCYCVSPSVNYVSADETTTPHGSGSRHNLDRNDFSIQSQAPVNAASSVDAAMLSISGTRISALRLLSYTCSTVHLPAGVPASVISNVRLPLAWRGPSCCRARSRARGMNIALYSSSCGTANCRVEEHGSSVDTKTRGCARWRRPLASSPRGCLRPDQSRSRSTQFRTADVSVLPVLADRPNQRAFWRTRVLLWNVQALLVEVQRRTFVSNANAESLTDRTGGGTSASLHLVTCFSVYPFFDFRRAAQNFFIRSLRAFLAAAVILRRRRRRMARLTVSTGAERGPPECRRRWGNSFTKDSNSALSSE